MVNQSSRLDLAFSALSDSTRRALLQQLTLSESTVSELAEPFKISLPAISKHLRILEEAGLISRHKTGRTHRILLNAGPLREALQWLEHYRGFWEVQLDSLGKHLSASKKS